MTGWIGITLGDVTGVGPEVTLKALAAEAGQDQTRYLLIGDEDRAHQCNKQLGLNLPLLPFSKRNQAGSFLTCNPLQQPLGTHLEAGSTEAARAAVAWLKDGAERCLRHELDALVTAPVNKEAIVRSGQSFIGQTEFLSELAGADRTAMMLLGHDGKERWLRVTLVTTHIPLKIVPAHITQAKVELAIEMAGFACNILGLQRARIAVCGLNPHAGEGGEMGDEEETTIRPAVSACRERLFNVVGPFSGDTVFHHALNGEYDVVVAMYHDQGLAPLKAVAFDTGVNWTLGLPFIRTSPDHGTAYDIAGQGIANPASMISAIRLAKQLAAGRE